jgi:acid phosphatase family membrane protein YuiD
MENLPPIFRNQVLWSALLAWGMAQWIKLPLEFFRTRKWNWALLMSAGGMPSSHSALVVGATLACGLYYGFDSPLFALGVAFSMIVIYDAANVRRQAGIHAQRINFLFEQLLSGHMVDEKQLREVLGHTPLEVGGGAVLGIVVSVAYWIIWP